MKQKSSAGAETTGGAAALSLAEFLPYRLNILAAAASEGLARLYSERFGIGVPEWRLIAALGEFRSMTAKAIGAHARMSKVKVSRAAAALEEKGLIARRANSADLRESFLVLTARGEAIYRKIVPLALAYQARLVEELSPDERAALDTLVTKLTARAEALGIKAENSA